MVLWGGEVGSEVDDLVAQREGGRTQKTSEERRQGIFQHKQGESQGGEEGGRISEKKA